MLCYFCKNDNRVGIKFCTKCGRELKILCPACEAPIEPGDAFCGFCGSQTALASDNISRTPQEEIEIKGNQGSRRLQPALNLNKITEIQIEIPEAGDTVNVTARIEDICTSKQILLSEDVYLKVKDDFNFKKAGEFQFKGKEKKLTIYELEGIKSKEVSVAAGLPILKARTRFVGREEEINLLRKYVKRFLESNGQVAGIMGEAGIGKSRLLYEIYKNYLATQDVKIATGKALSYKITSAYESFKDLIKELLKIDTLGNIEEIYMQSERMFTQMGLDLDLLEYIYELLDIPVKVRKFKDIGPEVRKKNIFSTVLGFITKYSEKVPLILVFEDLHWVDPLSRELLNQIVEIIRPYKILALAIFRPRFKQDWSVKDYYSQIYLRELEKTEVLSLAYSVLEVQELPREFENILVQKSEGNPLFAEELIKTFTEQGAIKKAGLKMVITEKFGNMKIPETIRSIFHSRVDRLGDTSKITLQHSAVTGRFFEHNILKDMLESEKIDFEKEIVKILNTDLVFIKQTSPEKVYAFKHVLTQESIYENILVHI